jgi:23S rRNA (pseudouridine1915-N3)-methyltransferase
MKIIAVGKLQTTGLKESFQHYHKQLKHIDVIEIKESTLEKESIEIIKLLKDEKYIIACVIEAAILDTQSFCKVFEDHLEATFVIGGSHGLDDYVKKIAHQHISFSKMTFPHQLARVILIEQIFRCEKIKQNHPYHK